jgi:hypothetical protein
MIFGLITLQEGVARVRPLEWCIDGHSLISSSRLCGEFGGQDGVVGF